MPNPRDALTPGAFETLRLIADVGSFAAAARSLNMVPSALTYRVRQMEQALGVRLFERGARQARLTDAGAELLRESGYLLSSIDAIAARIQRLATGWEPHFTIAVDNLIDRATVMELCERFHAEHGSPTQLTLRAETLSGTLEVVTEGEADLALGVASDALAKATVNWKPLGSTRLVFAVAPHHPLAKAPEPLTDSAIHRHRAVALADSTRKGAGLSSGLLPGQDVMTVTDLTKKIDAQISGVGVGFLPLCRAQAHVDAGRLVIKRVARGEREVQVGYAWSRRDKAMQGRALRWWLAELQTPVTRAALLGARCSSD